MFADAVSFARVLSELEPEWWTPPVWLGIVARLGLTLLGEKPSSASYRDPRGRRIRLLHRSRGRHEVVLLAHRLHDPDGCIEIDETLERYRPLFDTATRAISAVLGSPTYTGEFGEPDYPGDLVDTEADLLSVWAAGSDRIALQVVSGESNFDVLVSRVTPR